MKKLFILFLALTAFLGCKKNSTDTTVSLDVTTTNIAGTYKITAATASVGGLSTDVYNNPSVFPVCSKDDIYVFNSNGTYTITDAGVVCSPSNSISGNYSVNTAAKTITVGTQTYTVVSLT